MPDLSLKIRDAGLSHVGKVREINEDSILARSGDGLWAVADGMGGYAHGQWASETIISALQGIGGADFDGRARAVSEAVLAANTRIWAQSQSLGKSMGSTVAALLLEGSRYAVFWAGDSRCYLLRNKQITRLTTDHSQVQALVDAGLITPEQADSHPMAHVLSRAVGVEPQVVVETVAGEARGGDVFLLCTDGLTRVVPDAEIASHLGDKAPAHVAHSLVNLCLQRGAPDNVSAVIVACDEATSLAFA
jgi:serine/threonine-protein phosphatase Stp1